MIEYLPVWLDKVFEDFGNPRVKLAPIGSEGKPLEIIVPLQGLDLDTFQEIINCYTYWTKDYYPNGILYWVEIPSETQQDDKLHIKAKYYFIEEQTDGKETTNQTPNAKAA